MSAVKKAVFMGILLPALLLPLLRAEAAEDVCNFQSKFDSLRAIQVKGDGDYIEAVRAQLRVRKDILRAVIDCALKDVHGRQDELKSMPPEYRDSYTGKAIDADLGVSASFYESKKRDIENLGIKGTQDLARDIAFWRSHNYRPITERQDNFELWAKNQVLFQKTSARFAQMRPAVISITLIDHEDIKDAWSEAEDKFKEAEDKNDAAADALKNNPEDAPQLIKASLAPLSDIYKKFLEVSESIKKSVP